MFFKYSFIIFLLVLNAYAGGKSPPKFENISFSDEVKPIEAMISDPSLPMTIYPEAEQEKMLQTAKDWKLQAQKGKIAEAKFCIQGGLQTELCNVVSEIGTKLKPVLKVKLNLKTLRQTDLKRIIKAGQLKELNSYSEKSIGAVFSKIKNLIEMKEVAEPVLAFESCLNSQVYTQLAGTFEKEFPDQDARNESKKLHIKSIECGPSQASAKSGFKTILHHAWDEKWTDIITVADKIESWAEIDEYRPRILFWKHRAAIKLGQWRLAEILAAKLLFDYPQSLPSALVNREEFEHLMSDTPVPVLLLSKKREDLNKVSKWISVFFKSGEDLIAEKLIQVFSKRLNDSEPEFKMQFAIWNQRLDNSMAQFQVLHQVFRERPSLMCRRTLEMLFPLKAYEWIKKYENEIEPTLVISLIRQESGFNENARSRVGAMGLMQIMPRTARTLAKVSKTQLVDPETNIKLGVKYLGKLLNMFSGDVELALAGYNAGPLRVYEWTNRYGSIQDRALFLDFIPFKETREYVSAIARNYFWYSRLYPNQIKKSELSKFRVFD